MKVFISQPMRGKSEDEIRKERDSIISELNLKFPEGYELIDSYKPEWAEESQKSLGWQSHNPRVWCLGKSILMLSEANYAHFGNFWYDYEGCTIEQMVCEKYGIANNTTGIKSYGEDVVSNAQKAEIDKLNSLTGAPPDPETKTILDDMKNMSDQFVNAEWKEMDFSSDRFLEEFDEYIGGIVEIRKNKDYITFRGTLSYIRTPVSTPKNTCYQVIADDNVVLRMDGFYEWRGITKRTPTESIETLVTHNNLELIPPDIKNSIDSGEFTDPRDYTVYKTVKIGNQVWMAENLNYAAEGSVCYDNDEANSAKYGRLYDWETAKIACPAGWHLPTDEEWTELTDFVGGREIASKKLKSPGGWFGSGNGTDGYGFVARPGGYGYGGNFSNAGGYGYWWSATESDASYAWCRLMYYYYEGVLRGDNDKSYLFSVRCVKD